MKKLYLFLKQNKMLFTKDIKCSCKCLEEFLSLKLETFVLATDRKCLTVPRTVNVTLKQNILLWENT